MKHDPPPPLGCCTPALGIRPQCTQHRQSGSRSSEEALTNGAASSNGWRLCLRRSKPHLRQPVPGRGRRHCGFPRRRAEPDVFNLCRDPTSSLIGRFAIGTVFSNDLLRVFHRNSVFLCQGPGVVGLCGRGSVLLMCHDHILEMKSQLSVDTGPMRCG